MKIIVMMLILVLAIPLYATSVEGDTATYSLRISNIMSKEELEREHVPAVSFEILAVKPDEIVLNIPDSNKKAAAKVDVNTKLGKPINNKFVGGVRRIKSGRH